MKLQKFTASLSGELTKIHRIEKSVKIVWEQQWMRKIYINSPHFTANLCTRFAVKKPTFHRLSYIFFRIFLDLRSNVTVPKSRNMHVLNFRKWMEDWKSTSEYVYSSFLTSWLPAVSAFGCLLPAYACFKYWETFDFFCRRYLGFSKFCLFLKKSNCSRAMCNSK